jgi:hypothetical protein
VTTLSWKFIGEKSGPRNLTCQCSATARSSRLHVRLPSTSLRKGAAAARDEVLGILGWVTADQDGWPAR